MQWQQSGFSSGAGGLRKSDNSPAVLGKLDRILFKNLLEPRANKAVKNRKATIQNSKKSAQPLVLPLR